MRAAPLPLEEMRIWFVYGMPPCLVVERTMAPVTTITTNVAIIPMSTYPTLAPAWHWHNTRLPPKHWHGAPRGTAHHTIEFWNTNSGAVLNSIDTGSQVCSFCCVRSIRGKSVWVMGLVRISWFCGSILPMTNIQEFRGHTARVCLYLMSIALYFCVYLSCVLHARVFYISRWDAEVLGCLWEPTKWKEVK